MEGSDAASSSSEAVKAGLRRETDTDSDEPPGNEILKVFSCLEMTRYGPTYGVVRVD